MCFQQLHVSSFTVGCFFKLLLLPLPFNVSEWTCTLWRYDGALCFKQICTTSFEGQGRVRGAVEWRPTRGEGNLKGSWRMALFPGNTMALKAFFFSCHGGTLCPPQNLDTALHLCYEGHLPEVAQWFHFFPSLEFKVSLLYIIISNLLYKNDAKEAFYDIPRWEMHCRLDFLQIRTNHKVPSLAQNILLHESEFSGERF